LLSNLVALDAVTLTFLVISSLAAALIARLQSLLVTLLAGIVVGLCTALLTPVLLWPSAEYSLSVFRGMAPFVIAIVALLWLARRRTFTISQSDD
jgi:branched-chain amino acid transport system permease protein